MLVPNTRQANPYINETKRAIINSKLSGTLEKLAASSRKLRREREGLNLNTEK